MIQEKWVYKKSLKKGKSESQMGTPQVYFLVKCAWMRVCHIQGPTCNKLEAFEKKITACQHNAGTSSDEILECVLYLSTKFMS